MAIKHASGAPLAIQEARFHAGVKNWTAGKDGRGPWMRLRANAVQETDETGLRRQAPRDKPSIWQRERHHIRIFEVIGADGKQYGSSVFECSKDDWR
ncbi:MAG: hypothetical protein JNK06_04455 [Candidatus Accumulibacter phosphatis]|uniref:hypothetical protein n=1 Tax=Candidatus Accumulibacter phosphatis TaxID=327160 RepID=UPI001A45D6EA|nr:hypothetical protein [Candidatus Accumulibacter phosphatis]